MFVLGSDITIGRFRFSGVCDVQIRKSMHSIVESATIKIPSISRITSNGKTTGQNIVTGEQFSDGDPVVIKLGYNGDLHTEFIGFVKCRDLNMPLKVECEGYCWLLRRSTVTDFRGSIPLRQLLNLAVSSIDARYNIKVICDADIDLNNVVIDNQSGFEVINDLSKYTDDCLTCFFIQPDTLWCGLIYTSYSSGLDPLDLGLVNYRLGYNLVKENNLNERVSENDPVKVKYSKRLSNGERLFAESDAFKDYVRTHSRILNQLKDANALKRLANEKAYKLNYSGYEGNINPFLQPFALPGYQANIIDDRYPEKNGVYIIEGTEVRFGINGAKRIVEIGPKLGFAK